MELKILQRRSKTSREDDMEGSTRRDFEEVYNLYGSANDLQKMKGRSWCNYQFERA